MAVISKGISLSYSAGASTESWQKLTDLQEIPELGGDTESIEITTLDDVAHTYTNGIKNYGDSVAFKFLYATEQFGTLNALSGVNTWKVELPDGSTCSFNGTSSVKLDGAGINSALTYTLSVKPNSEMIFA